jgi:hypothetical protein
MNKLLAALIATLFAAGVAVAQDKKDETTNKDAAKPAAEAKKDAKPAAETKKTAAKPSHKKDAAKPAAAKTEEKKEEPKK